MGWIINALKILPKLIEIVKGIVSFFKARVAENRRVRIDEAIEKSKTEKKTTSLQEEIGKLIK